MALEMMPLMPEDDIGRNLRATRARGHVQRRGVSDAQQGAVGRREARAARDVRHTRPLQPPRHARAARARPWPCVYGHAQVRACEAARVSRMGSLSFGRVGASPAGWGFWWECGAGPYLAAMRSSDAHSPPCFGRVRVP
eukprot:3895887-Prymnesium_polylepis.1